LSAGELPPVLAGHLTPELRRRAESFYDGVAQMFDRWAARQPSPHTEGAYRRDVLSFVTLWASPGPSRTAGCCSPR
jgi:hypothetical protein